MTRISIIDPTTDARWDDFVLRHPLGSVFHSAAWAGVLMSSFSYRPRYMVVEDDGAIRGAVPFMEIDSWLTGGRLIGLPRTSYCDPLVQSPEDFHVLLQEAMRLLERDRLGYLEIKARDSPYPCAEPGLRAYGHFWNQVLDLGPGLDALWKGFDRSCVRQRITRAQKSGVVVRRGVGMEDLRRFYDLHRQSCRKNGVPRRPFAFFKNMWEGLAPTGSMILLMAEIGSDLGSAGVFLTSRDSVVFEFAANNPSHLEHSPVHLIVWEMIQHACGKGFRFLDFGLTPPGNAGLMSFKSRWGTRNRLLSYCYYPDVDGYKRFIAATNESEAPRRSAVGMVSERFKVEVATTMYRHFG